MHSICASEDYAFGINYIQEKYRDNKLVAVGMSMGAGLLLKHATLSGKNCLLKALAVVATPFNHLHLATASENWWPYLKIPNKFILKLLKTIARTVESQLHQWPDEIHNKGIDFKQIMNSNSFYEFNSTFSAKIQGLSADEYYQQGSTHETIDLLRIPVFALSSLDDPVIHSDGIPFQEFQEQPNIILATTTTEGHVGWYTGNLIPKRWFQIPCLEFLEACLEEN